MLTTIAITTILIAGIYMLSKSNPTYKKKDLTVLNELTKQQSVITITQDVERQLMLVLSDAGLSVIDEQITER
tara:strand:- start:9570 stop:9788 length:219 start_codon:yes stop_codon:yes gene_type:complete